MIPACLEQSPLRYAEDLARVPRTDVDLAITGNTKNLRLLADWPSIERLWVLGVNQREWDRIAPLVNPRMLMVYEMRVEDLSLPGGMSRLEELSLQWNTKAQSLAGLQSLHNLKTLVIRDFPKVRSLQPLSVLGKLRLLDLAGGMWKPLAVDSLAPLADLAGLEYLGLSNIRVGEGGLEPLCRLRGLRKLSVSNQFPTEQYARLSVCLPGVECSLFAPYVVMRTPVDGKDVMVVGKGKPFLNSVQDAARLEKYRAQFEACQAAFRA